MSPRGLVANTSVRTGPVGIGGGGTDAELLAPNRGGQYEHESYKRMNWRRNMNHSSVPSPFVSYRGRPPDNASRQHRPVYGPTLTPTAASAMRRLLLVFALSSSPRTGRNTWPNPRPLTETGLCTWPEGWPAVVWKKTSAMGQMAVTGDRLILFHRIGDEEVVECLDPATGNIGRL